MPEALLQMALSKAPADGVEGFFFCMGVKGFAAGPQGVRNERGHPIGNYKLCQTSGLPAACHSWDLTR